MTYENSAYYKSSWRQPDMEKTNLAGLFRQLNAGYNKLILKHVLDPEISHMVLV